MPSLIHLVVLVLVVAGVAAIGYYAWRALRKSGSATNGAQYAAKQGRSSPASPAVYAFLSDGCGACAKMKPTIEAAREQSPVEFTVVDLSSGDQWATDLMREHRVTRVPTLLRFDGAGAPARYDGDRSLDSVLRFAASGRSA